MKEFDSNHPQVPPLKFSLVVSMCNIPRACIVCCRIVQCKRTKNKKPTYNRHPDGFVDSVNVGNRG